MFRPFKSRRNVHENDLLKMYISLKKNSKQEADHIGIILAIGIAKRVSIMEYGVHGDLCLEQLYCKIIYCNLSGSST